MFQNFFNGRFRNTLDDLSFILVVVMITIVTVLWFLASHVPDSPRMNELFLFANQHDESIAIAQPFRWNLVSNQHLDNGHAIWPDVP